MSLLVCVNGAVGSSYAETPLVDGRCAIDLLAERVSALPDVCGVVVFDPGADKTAAERHGAERRRYPARWRRFQLSGRGERALLDALQRAVSEHDECDTVLYCHIDAPFLDLELCRSMIADHRRYVAEYSFADGYPSGLAPELLAPSVFPRLMPLVQDSAAADATPRAEPGGREPEVPRDLLFRIIQRDINAFDIETALSDHDQRMLRIELYCDTRRNWELCRRLCELGATTARAIVERTRQEQRLLRTLPAYISIDIVDGSLQDVAYSPYRLFGPAGKGKQREMVAADVGRIVADVERFSPGGVYSLGLWGEPGLHSDPEGVVAAVTGAGAEADGTRPVVIETSGVGWDAAVFERLARRENVTWIVHLDAVDPEVYARVRGSGFDEAMGFCTRLLELTPERGYIQSVRYTDVEQHTEQFYRYWKERTDHIIVQKYDHFCGELQDKRITDISPVKRFPCWHLRRDLTVLVDGTVPRCREDIRHRHAVGNLLIDGVERVWQALEPVYAQHAAGSYPDICRNCDEYYTFNF